MSPQIDSEFEHRVHEKVEPYLGRQIDEIGREVGVKSSRSKGYPANVVRILLFSFVPAGPADFERRSIEIKTVRKPRVGRPYEAMSFPAFDANELVRESWARSTLCRLLAPNKTDHLGTSRLGKPVFWSPNGQQLETIKSEWENFRILIGGGAALRLPGAASTSAIHVRTHGQDARDRAFAPGVGYIPKRSFWLNQDFVRSIIE